MVPKLDAGGMGDSGLGSPLGRSSPLGSPSLKVQHACLTQRTRLHCTLHSPLTASLVLCACCSSSIHTRSTSPFTPGERPPARGGSSTRAKGHLPRAPSPRCPRPAPRLTLHAMGRCAGGSWPRCWRRWTQRGRRRAGCWTRRRRTSRRCVPMCFQRSSAAALHSLPLLCRPCFLAPSSTEVPTLDASDGSRPHPYLSSLLPFPRKR